MKSVSNVFKGRQQSLSWLVIIFISFGFVFLVFMTDNPNVRYASYAAQCRMIYGYDTTSRPIDLVSIGSSRSMRAMQAGVLADNVSNLYDVEKPVIFDLSRSYRDMGHMFVFIKDMLENNTVRMLLVEYKENGDGWYHHNFKNIATLDQILDLHNSRPSLSFAENTYTKYTMILERVSAQVTMIITGKPKVNCVPETQKKLKAAIDPSSPWFVNSSLLVKMQQNVQEKLASATFELDYLSSAEERNIYYMRKIVELARFKNVDLFFYYIPSLYGPSFSPDFVADFNQEFNAKLLQLSPEILKDIYPAGYTDATHMGQLGSRAYMRYLAETLPWL